MVEIFDNIHKIYQYQPPCGELAAYIEFFSESSPQATREYIIDQHFNVKLFPSWTPTFWFNLGSPYQLLIGNKHYSIKADDDVLLLRNSIVERYNLPTDHIFTVKFSPGGFEAVFGIKQSVLGDNLINLATILPPLLIQQIKRVDNFEERVNLLQHFLLVQWQQQIAQAHQFRTVQKAIEAYHRSNMEYNTNEIAREVFATNKTIYRYFNQVVGTTPKNYFSTLRVRNALLNYVTQSDFSPYDFGYYDMSHFHKDVVKFTGRKLIDNLA
ncbi:AraC family transcriptional regulator [Emticicia sp. BO119]|uniref:helix-turn-helix domain-containing protein n=1 Tax=Emticicia sp. BO119 TaxID=2757768 RepID=UPI0015F08AB7|nr:helix-turn-helix domain-containing protein [Emticicia sp. BO119]MBA4852859.1 AraC family transcriptional regulator [Emticicia sp. BO119]